MDNSIPSPEEKLQIEQVAEFADKALSPEFDMESASFSDQADVQRLQQTILRLRVAAQAARPTPSATVRVRSKVLAHWSEVQREHPARKQFVWPWSLGQTLAVSGGLAALALAIVFSPLENLPISLPGAAQGSSALLPVFILVGITLLIGLIWFIRRR